MPLSLPSTSLHCAEMSAVLATMAKLWQDEPAPPFGVRGVEVGDTARVKVNKKTARMMNGSIGILGL